MGVKIIMTVCMLPILLILYGVMWFCTGERDRMQFGVTLWKGARDSAQVQRVRKTYKKELNRCAALCFLLFLLTLIPKHESLVVTGQMIWMLFVLVIMFVPFARANRRLLEQKREYHASLPEEQQTLIDEDGDEHWKWGLFYYNKNDKRSMVDKHVGIGVTCNMAKPCMKYGSIMFIVVFVVWMMGMCVWMVAEDFTPVSLSFQEGTLTADHWKEVYHIEENQIKSVELLETLPEMSKRNGTGMETVKKGDFYSSTYERDFEVCLNPQKPPFLLIETKKGTWYLLGGDDSGQTREIYPILAEKFQ